MTPLFVSFILGVLLLLFCVFSYILPYGEKFKDKVQKLKGLGMELEVSVLTLFLLISFVLIFFGGGIWLQLQSIDTQLEELKAEKIRAETRANELQDKLNAANAMEMVAFLKLDGTDELNYPDPTNVECLYETATGNGARADVSVGAASGTFKINSRNVTRDTILRSLVFKTKDNKKKWRYEDRGYMPLQPVLELKQF